MCYPTRELCLKMSLKKNQTVLSYLGQACILMVTRQVESLESQELSLQPQHQHLQ